MTLFVLGFFVGGAFGIVVFTLLLAAKQAEDAADYLDGYRFGYEEGRLGKIAGTTGVPTAFERGYR